MRKDQKGFSLIELLIAVVIMSVVMAAVCGFIIVGSKSYAAANSDIAVQSEAQLSLNQMSDVLIDTTRSVNYAGYDASGSTTQLAIKDSEFTFEPMGKSLTMYNGVVTETKTPGGGTSTSVETGNGNKHYQFYWDKTDETLYYTELAVQSTDVKLEDIHFPAFGDPAWVVLAEHVTDFSIDLSQVEEKRVVQIAMTFVNGTKEYNTSNNITIRNKVGINDADIESIKRSKTLKVDCKDSGIILEPGEIYHFSVPVVYGENVMDKSVTWSMDPAYGGSSYFIDTTNGILQIANDEPAGELRVVITTNAVDSDGNHVTLTVPVMIKRVTDIAMSKIDDEVAENGPTEVTIGKKFSIQASVNGVKLGVACNGGCTDDITKDKDVINWQVEGPATRVDTDGDVLKTEYRVNDNAKEGDIITIRATSLLSTKRPYPDVVGVIKLTVKKGSSHNMYFDGDLKWGRHTVVKGEYPDDFNKGGNGYFLVCARVKEDLGAPASQDKIMIYRTNGLSAEMTPDLFGVENIQKPWYVSLQILDPGYNFQSGVGPSAELLRDIDQQIKDLRLKGVIDDYLNNCDASGTYNGSYPHTEKVSSVIYPPQIYWRYGGKDNIEGQLHMEPLYAAKGTQDAPFSVKRVKNTRADDGSGEVNDYVKFSVYRKQGSSWQRLYHWNQNNYYQKDDGQNVGNDRIGALYFNVSGALNARVQLDGNQNPAESIGEYKIVPMIKYWMNPSAEQSYQVYYANYQPDYWHVQLYELSDDSSSVFIEVKGGNIELNGYYDNSYFENSSGYFPLPSETDFTKYFKLEDTSKQEKTGVSARVFVPHRNTYFDVPYTKITCQYIKKEDAYELSFWYWDGRQGYNRELSAGTYKCKSDGTKWEKVSVH